MTQTFATNENNDIYLGRDGNIVIASGIDGVLNACETIARSQLGEMILSIESGLPNFQAVWVGSPNYAIFQAYLRNALVSVPGVLDVKDISILNKDNTLQYTATIQTQFGSGVITND